VKDILDQMEAWRKNARFISEQDFFSRMIFEIVKTRKEIERLREALRKIANEEECFPIQKARDALKDKE
jgi:hypothetical protein